MSPARAGRCAPRVGADARLCSPSRSATLSPPLPAARAASVEHIDCVVVGAGVVGLAVGRALAMAGREVVILEANDMIGAETSSRNSGVIHAGIYYPPGSLKAQLCVRGKHALYRFCADHSVEHARVGKLLVATAEDQLASLDAFRRRAAANGVDDLEPLGPKQVAELEPEVRCVGALRSPSTGIIDAHGFMLALQGDAESNGAMVALLSPLQRARATDRGLELEVGGAQPMRLGCSWLINCAGLHAQRVARRIEGLAPETIPPGYLAKGNYFQLRGRTPFRRLIYPMPVGGSLGVHVGLDLSGRCRFGPDIHWVEQIDYDVDETQAPAFYAAIRRYWPGLPDGALAPDYTGIRPKITPPGAAAGDFIIAGPVATGVDGLVCLYGIESPGLTSALAIADHVAAVVRG